MGDVRATAGDVLFVGTISAANIRSTMGSSLTVFNFPTESIATQEAITNVVYRRDSTIQVQQAQALVLTKGRVEDPKVRAWTFTLDSHDFYVLRLGNFETLVYDIKTEQWYTWASLGSNVLPLDTGISWLGGNRLAATFGSNILCTDDTIGTLYLMSPESPFDEGPLDYLSTNRFDRIVQGQLPVRGYSSIPCFGAQVYGDIGQADETLTVTLETSDDSGFNYSSQGDISILPGEYKTRVDWRSLGSMTAPGRLFKITDDGAFARIDGLEVASDGGSEN